MQTKIFSMMLLTIFVLLGATGVWAAAPKSGSTADRIEASARKSYVFSTYLKGEDVQIKATNAGDVTLTGTVSQWSHRSLAEDAVSGISGVKHVNNNLEVNGGQPAENSDAWIGMKVKTVLLFNRNVSGLNTDVDVQGGVVTLTGTASSEAQKELTTEYAKDVEGVQSVTNTITVLKTEKSAVEKAGEYIDDASITAQVKLALLFHRSTSVIKTNVETINGHVTVSGVAKNDAEKDLVGKLVNDINGVKSVKNDMTIG
jgi:hyperosmotically inducible protein